MPAAWAIYDPGAEDGCLADDVREAYAEIYRRRFAAEPLVNHRLPIEVRALRRYRGWRICLLLTPWHLVRLLFPSAAPPIELPDDWSAPARRGAEYAVIGPALALPILPGHERAHLNYQPRLGHYLVQPLVQSLLAYASADAVFAAWSEVIAVRDRNIAARRQHCEWQGEVSRREFLGRLRRSAKD